MRGGDDGRYVLPASYFGKGTVGYYEEGSPELASGGNQYAVSQGTVWENGKYAGPNLYPMTGGNCGCKRKSKTHKRKLEKKNAKKSKKQQTGGFWSQLLG